MEITSRAEDYPRNKFLHFINPPLVSCMATQATIISHSSTIRRLFFPAIKISNFLP